LGRWYKRRKATWLILALAASVLDVGNFVSVAMETNGRGFIGFLVELPGAFVRGRSEPEALSKVHCEARSYLDWLGIPGLPLGEVRVVERHTCSLTVEDADSDILLTADLSAMTRDGFESLSSMARRSGETFVSLYDSSRLRNWVDRRHARSTFYGEAPRTIGEVFAHVRGTQHYYLSRVGADVKSGLPFMGIRESGLERLGELFRVDGNSKVFRVDGEQWTLKKVLRRFIWHDRIHGKAITRILAKQKELGLIEGYVDPFRFGPYS
jgi:hypothetical protein